MGLFVVRRLLWTAPVLLVVLTLVFFGTRAIGGDPLRPGPLVGVGSSGGFFKRGDPKPQAIQDNMTRKFMLHRPWYEQYGYYLEGVARLDLGRSMSYPERSVRDVIGGLAPRSFLLGALAAAIAAAVGVPAGIAAGVRSGGRLDLVVQSLTGIGVAVPSFLTGTLLIYLVSVRLGWLPTSGWDAGWSHRVLPAVTLALLPTAYCARLMRASTIEVLASEHVTAARARGLRRSTVLRRHVARNAAVPLLAAAGPIVGALMTSAFIVENIFDVPGIGRFYVAATVARDYPLILGLTALLATIVVLANLLADVAQALLDPRSREQLIGPGTRPT